MDLLARRRLMMSLSFTSHDYSQDYLTFRITTAGTIGWKMYSSSSTSRTIYYKLNSGEWTSITSTYAGVYIDVSAGDIIQWKGTNSSYSDTSSKANVFSGSADFVAYGNIMSLIGGDNFVNTTSFGSAEYIFCRLFYQTYIQSAENLILPVTTLVRYCYNGMFSGCTRLTKAPALPATSLASYCYNEMFMSCYALAVAPTLPATTLADRCYRYMFGSCTGLTTAPVLSAQTLISNCYYRMFNGASNLNYIECTATDISASNALQQWVDGVAATGTFVKDSSTTWPAGVSGIPSGWTVQNA